MKSEKTPPPSKRPDRRGPRASGHRKTSPARSKRDPEPSDWTEGEIELYRLALSQGKGPIESIDDLAFLAPQDAEQLLDAAKEGRRIDAQARATRERLRER